MAAKPLARARRHANGTTRVSTVPLSDRERGGSAMLNPVPERVGPVPYRAYPDAPVIRWPNGGRIALWIVPNLEWYPVDKTLGPNKLPDIKSWAIREYGERVGVWRIMEALDTVGARA